MTSLDTPPLPPFPTNLLPPWQRDLVEAAATETETRPDLGALAVLAETLANIDDPAVARTFAERIADEATRVGAIVDDLLAAHWVHAAACSVDDVVAQERWA